MLFRTAYLARPRLGMSTAVSAARWFSAESNAMTALLACSTVGDLNQITSSSSLASFSDQDITTALEQFKRFNVTSETANDGLNRVVQQAAQVKFRAKLLPQVFAAWPSASSVPLPAPLLQQVQENVRHFQGADLEPILAKMTTTGEGVAVLLNRIALDLSKRRDPLLDNGFDLDQLVNLLARYRELNCKNVALCERVADEIFALETLKPMRAKHFLSLLDSFAFWEFRDKDLFQRWSEELCQRTELDEFTNEDFHHMMDALLSLDFPAEDLSAKFSHEMETRVTRVFFRKWNKLILAVAGTGALYIVSPLVVMLVSQKFA